MCLKTARWNCNELTPLYFTINRRSYFAQVFKDFLNSPFGVPKIKFNRGLDECDPLK